LVLALLETGHDMTDAWPSVLAPVPAPGFAEPPAESVVVRRGKRVHLRTLLPADLEHLSAWCEDPFLQRMVGSEFFQAYKHVYDKSTEFYDACLTDATQVVFMVEANHGWTQPLGIVRLFNIHLLEGYAFLETIITDHRALKRGYGIEAGRLISYYGVDVLGLRRIEAKVYEYNRLSINALRRNGFTQEGVLRQAGFQEGRYWDLFIFGILKDEIETQRGQDRICYPTDG
jgi:RimJ/RimL family protein N-acetyltransferase